MLSKTTVDPFDIIFPISLQASNNGLRSGWLDLVTGVGTVTIKIFELFKSFIFVEYFNLVFFNSFELTSLFLSKKFFNSFILC